MTEKTQISEPPQWTRDGFRQGALDMLPLLPGLFAFGLAFGTVAARKGFTLLDTIVMSATVFAGVAQIIVTESWPETLTLSAILGIVAVTAMVCMRFLLIGASLQPWLGSQPAIKIYPTLYLLTEPNWLLAMRYHANGGRDPAYLLGAGVMVWILWVVPAAPGYWLGASVGDPHRFGLDLIMPAFFTAMLVTMYRSPRRSVGWVVAGAVAILSDILLGGFWFIVIGATAGAVAGGFIDDPE